MRQLKLTIAKNKSKTYNILTLLKGFGDFSKNCILLTNLKPYNMLSCLNLKFHLTNVAISKFPPKHCNVLTSPVPGPKVAALGQSLMCQQPRYSNQVFTVQSALCTVHCELCTVHFEMYTVNCTL